MQPDSPRFRARIPAKASMPTLQHPSCPRIVDRALHPLRQWLTALMVVAASLSTPHAVTVGSATATLLPLDAPSPPQDARAAALITTDSARNVVASTLSAPILQTYSQAYDNMRTFTIAIAGEAAIADGWHAGATIPAALRPHLAAARLQVSRRKRLAMPVD
jgi:hypothetical protein